jgi:hypothetical protein
LAARRYGLIALGTWFTSKGWIAGDQWETIIAGIGTLFPVLWGLFVKSGTKAVPESVAARSDVPTVSGGTGQVQK